VKKSNMDKGSIKELMFGGVQEIMRNRKYYYNSTVSSDYSHWTEEGKEAICEFMSLMGREMLRAEEIELNQRAKELVIKGLKGETTPK